MSCDNEDHGGGRRPDGVSCEQLLAHLRRGPQPPPEFLNAACRLTTSPQGRAPAFSAHAQRSGGQTNPSPAILPLNYDQKFTNFGGDALTRSCCNGKEVIPAFIGVWGEAAGAMEAPLYEGDGDSYAQWGWRRIGIRVTCFFRGGISVTLMVWTGWENATMWAGA
jgi:hypothetical protein